MFLTIFALLILYLLLAMDVQATLHILNKLNIRKRIVMIILDVLLIALCIISTLWSCMIHHLDIYYIFIGIVIGGFLYIDLKRK